MDKEEQYIWAVAREARSIQDIVDHILVMQDREAALTALMDIRDVVDFIYDNLEAV